LDVTAKLELLGIPLESKYASGNAIYARNVWDLFGFGGLLFIGSGNSSNIGPAPNAGPAEVWSFDPSSSSFASEGTVPDEQIDVYRVIGSKLTIPGHDPKEAWELGNFYTRQSGGSWVKTRTIPDGIHNYDMREHGGNIYAALGSQKGGVVVESADGGSTWKEHLVGGGRMHRLFELTGKLYASGAAMNVHVLGSSGFSGKLATSDFFPGLEQLKQPFGVYRAVEHAGRLVYVVATNVNDHQWRAYGLFGASAPGSAALVSLPMSAIAWDLALDGTTLYVLAQSAAASGKIVNHVFGSTDGVTFNELAWFEADTFARSFEILGGDFYFGLGCEESEIVASTGTILRLSGSYVRGL
jgi:hypothetical protein